MSRVHVIGAGLAGLAAAVRLAGRGVSVEVSEAAAQAGGRCRSYFDRELGLTIDNGNHLVLSGNQAVKAYLKAIRATDRLTGPKRAAFDWQDLRTGEQWRLAPNEGPLPWWVMSQKRRVPGTTARDYLALGKLASRQPRDRRVDEVLTCEGPLWERLMQPFLVAALNTEPEGASAELAAAVVRETLAKGGAAYRPRIAEPTLAAAFVDPAVEYLVAHGGSLRLGRRLKRIVIEDGRVDALDFGDEEIDVGRNDRVVLAVPPWVAQSLLPGLSAPDEFRSIVNGHFRIAAPVGSRPMVGLIGGTAEWVFAFHDRISVTVSAADRIVDWERERLARALWKDVAAVHGFSEAALPPWQIVKEKRATFAATPEQDAKRPPPHTDLANLVLAGDWIQTGLPSTIEGALRSGFKAAGLV